jgi:hypothetical protein
VHVRAEDDARYGTEERPVHSDANGRPWHTEKNDKELGKEWRAHMRACGLYAKEAAERLHFNDLRGTAVNLPAEAGATVPQIVAITGHTLESVTRILEKYLARTQALSDAAIYAFENAKSTAFANRLQTTPTSDDDQRPKVVKAQ